MQVDYANTSTPEGYVCANCGKSGVKLWREYQTPAPQLLCLTCAAGHQKRTITETTDKGRVLIAESSRPKTFTDQIGWYVPAVPSEHGYWGYTSAPDEGVQWWQRLPNS